MPSWIEKMAWEIACPTCRAEPGAPCCSVYHPDRPLEFNHPARNQRYHLDQQRRRSRERRRALPDHPSVPGGS